MTKLKHILRATSLLLGLGGFVYTINRFGGADATWSHLIAVGPWYIAVLANSLVWTLVYSGAWQILLAGLTHKIHFLALLRIKFSGESINLMTPFGFIAGDPIRVLLLKDYFPLEARLRSVVIDRCLHSMAAQYFALIGLVLLLLTDIAFPVWLNLLIVAMYLVATSVLTGLFFAMISGSGYGVFDWIFRLINIRKRFPKVHDKLEELNEELSFYQHRPKRHLLSAFLLHLLGRAMMAVEIGLVMYCFRGEILVIFAIILASLSSFFAVVFGFIPGALGVLEGLYAHFALMYGFDPAMGLSIQLVRRIRVLVWIVLGALTIDFHAVANFIRNVRVSGRLKDQIKDLTKT